MAAFSISTPSPSSATISVPDTVTLSFDVSGNDPSQVKLSYHINGDNNVFFELANGNQVKEIVQNFTLQNPPQTFDDELKIVKGGNNPDYSLAYIYIDGLDTDNNDSDHQLFTIHFS
jgi:hypothetical protein